MVLQQLLVLLTRTKVRYKRYQLRQDRFGIEGQLQYAFDMGKVWVSGAIYKVNNSCC
jgi:hypothetical protein